MCGQLGLVYGPMKRHPEERSYLKWLFIHLLLLSERRGPYATGIAWLKKDGSHNIFKRPMRAVEFVKERQFIDVISQVDDDTTWLAGHTRWPTQGSHLDNANNHPLVSRAATAGDASKQTGVCILTHNGHIENSAMLFRALGIRRETQVDSEILLRLAERNLTKSGIDLDCLARDLSLCRGRMSFVVAATNDPTRIILVKGNQPLKFRYSERHQALLYASEARFLDEALGEEDGWVEWRIPPMRMVVVHTDNLAEPTIKPFRPGV